MDTQFVNPSIRQFDMVDWDDMAVVGRVARPHGLRGDVVVTPETDFIAERFRPGATVWTRSAGREEELTIASARVHSGRPVVGFEGLSSIEAAQRLTGLELRVPEESLQPLEPGSYYEHQLVGCSVETVQGMPVGTVIRVDSGAGGSRLVIDGARGEILVPLAVDICVEIDVAGRTIRIEPPEGLLELNEVRHRHDLSPDGGGRPRRRGDQPRR
jgi:16S rRNA processing protein RimM